MENLGPDKSKINALYEMPLGTSRLTYVYHVYHCTFEDFQSLRLPDGRYLLVSAEGTLHEFEIKNGYLEDLDVSCEIDDLPEYLIESIYFGPTSIALSENPYPKMLEKPGLQSFLQNEIGLYGK